MGSQRSSSQEEQSPSAEEEWQMVPTTWWRTPFSSISWSYEPEKASQNLVFAKPPHYHHSLYSGCSQDGGDHDDGAPHTPSEWRPSTKCRIAGEDDVLNEELIGVKGATDVVKPYERAVGFGSSPWPDEGQEDKESLDPHVTPVDVELGRERWNELVENLVGGTTLDGPLKDERRSSQSSATQLPIDCFSPPSTPKQFQLNPSASSFVPLGSPTSSRSSSSDSSLSDSSDRIVAYPFPSFNNSPSLTSSKIEHQNYIPNTLARSRATSSVSCSGMTSDGLSDTFLPPFLLETSNSRRRPHRTSRTRAIVDQLRSRYNQSVTRSLPASQDSSPTISEFGAGNLTFFQPRLTVSDDGVVGSRSSICSPTPPLVEDQELRGREIGGGSNDNVEGWTFPPTPTIVDPETKRTRSRELLMTLRRRTDSLSSNVNSASSPTPGSKFLGVSPTYASVVASEPEVLVESPELTGATVADTHSEVHQEADEYESEGWSNGNHAFHQGTQNNHPFPSIGSSSRPFSNYSNSALRFDASPCPSPSQAATYPHTSAQSSRSQNHTYSRTHSRSSSFTSVKYPSQGYVNNSPTVAPYALVSIPLPLSALSMNMTMPSSIPAIPLPMIGNSVAVPIPVQVPVQAMQYSTLMHLRIMQQMQMMRNSMESLGLTTMGAGVRGQIGSQTHPGMTG